MNTALDELHVFIAWYDLVINECINKSSNNTCVSTPPAYNWIFQVNQLDV